MTQDVEIKIKDDQGVNLNSDVCVMCDINKVRYSALKREETNFHTMCDCLNSGGLRSMYLVKLNIINLEDTF